MPESKRSSPFADGHVWVVVLAGGIGSRFWPASTPERPKQLLPLATERPLIVDTVERARALVTDARVRVLAREHLAFCFRSVLPDLPSESYWIEPSARGTGPVLAWAAWRIARLDPDAVMVSLHADHLIRPVEAFRESVELAVKLAREEDLLLSIGVRPAGPETAYGYVEPGPELDRSGEAVAYRVRAFHEKPDPDTAARYVRKGYLWNTGIFVWKAAVLLEEVRRHAPEIAEILPLLERDEAHFFREVPVSVVDRAVMERSGRVGTVRASFEWDDVGGWESLARTRPRDAFGNVAIGKARVVDGRDNIVYADGGRVVVLGAEGLVVVRAGDTTMVLPRGRTGELKKLLAELERMESE